MVSSRKSNRETTKPRSDGHVVHNTRSSGSKSEKPPKPNNVKKEREIHEISESSSTGSVEEVVRDHEPKKSNGVVAASKGRNGKGVAIPAKRRRNGKEEVVDAEIRFPMNRIRRIMREDNSTPPQIMQDAVYLVNKATEMFIARISEEVYESSVQDKKKFIHYKHISSVVSNDDKYEFLADSVPEKLKAEVATEEWEKAMADGG